MLVSVTTIVTSCPRLPRSPAGVWLVNVSVVDEVRPVTLPSACSPAGGTGCAELVGPVAVREPGLVPGVAVKVQVKLVEAPGASVVAPPVKLAHLPPPVTFTPVSEVVPVLVSVTTIVISRPTGWFAPGGVWLANISVVDDVRPVTLPSACSPAGRHRLCRTGRSHGRRRTRRWPRRHAVNVQVKLVEAPGASVVAPPVKLAHLPPPVTFTPVSEVVPVLVSVTTIVIS